MKTLIFCILFIITNIHSKEILLDKTLATVNNTLISFSDVALFFQINKILSMNKQTVKNFLKKSSKNKSYLFKMTTSDIKSTVERIIVLELLYQELQKFDVKPIPHINALNQFKSIFPNLRYFNEYLSILTTTEKQLSIFLSKKYSADIFLETKIKRQNFAITDATINQYKKRYKSQGKVLSDKELIEKIKINENSNLISDFIKKLLERNEVKIISTTI